MSQLIANMRSVRPRRRGRCGCAKKRPLVFAQKDTYVEDGWILCAHCHGARKPKLRKALFGKGKKE